MLRFISYNIHSGRDLFWRKRLQEMGRSLKEWQADIIGLQEVHQNSKYGYQASYLAETLQYELAFAPSIPFADGHYGNALLSRFPLHKVSILPLPSRKEKRTLLQASISYQHLPVHIWVTHCSLNQASRWEQLRLISELACKRSEEPLVLMGDFNMTNAIFPHLLADCAHARQLGHIPTIPSFRRRIDYIFASSQWRVHHYETLPVKWSDHLPVLTDLELLPPTPQECNP
ncbi:endonuclease/exonuclease/phosphatase family protein [Brevibacillus ruminantium]|uniref:Endonuclease/exonuclease/phosphatase family protein n=1 Tax=Brevibacillus ruminantium TaxID=2950604 RepID=A0ABY4W9J1_9BACL|nr:endonuclease/exonuclease/phosphatase family protein [Brevibacillus ruminantium]USG63838.1 endonuclease/exonuclease/phosphatase family protein [Brevibacillus ruminantium]